jgi:hypothetical protein
MTGIENLKNILSSSLHLLIFKIVHRLAIKIRDFFNFKRANKLRLSDEYEKLFLKESGFYNSKDCGDKYHFINSIFSEILTDECWDRLINLDAKNFIIENLKNGQMIIKNADLSSSHIFDLLGSGKVKVSYRLKPKGVENNIYSMGSDEIEIKNCINKINGRILIISKSLGEDELKSLQGYKYDPIDWHIDFKSGYRWDDKTWYRKIRFGTIEGADIKVPWELSRCYHFLALGQAYFITGDEKYTKEFIYQFIDWVENNPIQFGVNWVCTMDVAIRACNWVLSFLYFKNSKLINKEFLYEFIKNIFIHGLHIRKNLERDSFSPKTNHYISNLAGLIYIGKFLDNLRFGKSLLDFAIRELNKEVRHQVYNDGSSFETSTCYHRLVLELLFYPVLFLTSSYKEFNGYNFKDVAVKIFGDGYIKKIFKMFEVLKYCLNPNGYIPQIGDNDNGRLHVFGYSEVLDATYLLQIASVFFNESSFKILDFNFINSNKRKDEILWIFGKAGSEIWDNLEGVSIKSIESHAFLNSGWFIMRKNNNFLMVSAGQNGQGSNGGHAHNDKLSFELVFNGIDIIRDPGTYLYTPIPKMRNLFRSTGYHNTIVVDQKEQNRLGERNLFFLANDSAVEVKKWVSNSELDFLDSEHYGYIRLQDSVIHRRKIFFDKTSEVILIKDLLRGKGRHLFELYFHLDKDIQCEISQNFCNLFYQNHKIMGVYSLEENELNISLGEYFLSEGYGNKNKAQVIKYFKEAKTPAEFIFLFYNPELFNKSDFKEKIKSVEKYSMSIPGKAGI